MKRILDHLRTGLCWEVNHFFVKMRKFLLIFLGVILIALVNVTAANSEEQTNPGSELNSRELRGAERKENGQKRSKKKKNKKKKRRQRKKNRKRKGRKGKGRGQKRTRGDCPACPGCRQQVSTSSPETMQCVAAAVTGMKVWKDQAGNFLNRKKRIEKQIKIMDGKFDKRMDFSGISDNITFVGGGDSKNLSCSGSNTSSKAVTLSSLKTSLDSCNSSIGTDCNSTLVLMELSLNETYLEECFNMTTNYTTQAAACVSSSAPCSCWATLVNGNFFGNILNIYEVRLSFLKVHCWFRLKLAVLQQKRRK